MIRSDRAAYLALVAMAICFGGTWVPAAVAVDSVPPFTIAAAKVANRDYRLVEMYTFVAVVYFIISYSLSTLVRRLQDRIAILR